MLWGVDQYPPLTLNLYKGMNRIVKSSAHIQVLYPQLLSRYHRLTSPMLKKGKSSLSNEYFCRVDGSYDQIEVKRPWWYGHKFSTAGNNPSKRNDSII
jgi:hypothetical protein